MYVYVCIYTYILVSMRYIRFLNIRNVKSISVFVHLVQLEEKVETVEELWRFSPPRCFRICAENRSSFEQGYIRPAIRKEERERERDENDKLSLFTFWKRKKEEEEKEGGGDLSLSRRSVFASTRSKIGVNARLVGQCQSTTSVHSQARFKVRKGG